MLILNVLEHACQELLDGGIACSIKMNRLSIWAKVFIKKETPNSIENFIFLNPFFKIVIFFITDKMKYMF